MEATLLSQSLAPLIDKTVKFCCSSIFCCCVCVSCNAWVPGMGTFWGILYRASINTNVLLQWKSQISLQHCYTFIHWAQTTANKHHLCKSGIHRVTPFECNFWLPAFALSSIRGFNAIPFEFIWNAIIIIFWGLCCCADNTNKHTLECIIDYGRFVGVCLSGLELCGGQAAEWEEEWVVHYIISMDRAWTINQAKTQRRRRDDGYYYGLIPIIMP